LWPSYKRSQQTAPIKKLAECLTGIDERKYGIFKKVSARRNILNEAKERDGFSVFAQKVLGKVWLDA